MKFRLLSLFASTALFAASAAAAHEVGQDHDHGEEAHNESEAIVVTGHFVRDLDLLAGKSTLSGEELQREIRPQIGDTLTRLPGVSATSFTPGASRPVLRGFQGERIRVLTDGIGAIDASNTSADHAVTIDPLTVERIEVLRGPAVLLFGSQAIGGAVNAIDRRIPREVPDHGYHVDLTGALGSAADERSIGAGADVALGSSGIVIHGDGSWRKTNDLEVGGHVLSPQLRAEQLAIAAEEAEEGHAEEAAEALELANLRGTVPNSAAEQKTLGAGIAYIAGPISLGVSVGWFDSDYGVPTRPGVAHHHEGEEPEEEEHGDAPVTIGLTQTRYDGRAEYKFDAGFLETARLRIGASDYEHTEFEGDEVGTVFMVDGVEGRFELAQRDRNGWRGVTGAQYFHRNFDAVGAEAFVPRNETSQLGLFTLQEITLGKAGIEGALRFEHTGVQSDPTGFDRSFNTVSAAAGGSYEVGRNAKLGFNLSRSERAPSAEELLSNGPHVATQAFEVGDPGLKKEKSLGAEAYFRVDRRGISFNATIFANWFDDFIYQAATGEEQDELPVFQYFQEDARYYGFELEASAPVATVGGFKVVADGVADYVRATVKGGGPVPRIPPLRLLGGLEAQSERLDGRVEVEWVADQDRLAAHETPTDGHTMVNASLAWKPFGRRSETNLVLSANNIFDVDARRHASFTKDFVPMPGRDIRLSVRVAF